MFGIRQLLFLCACCIPLSFFAQSPSAKDSLWSVWQNTELDSLDRQIALYHLSVLYRDIDLDSAILIGRTYRAMAYTRSDTLGMIISNIQLSHLFFTSSAYDSATTYVRQGLVWCDLSQNFRWKARGKIRWSSILRKQGRFNEAIAEGVSALEIIEQRAYESEKGSLFTQFGHIYLALKERKLALEYYQKALDNYKKFKTSPRQYGTVYNNMGIVYRDLGQYEKALPLLFKSASYKKEGGDIDGLSNTLNNTGEVYFRMGELTKAKDLFLESLWLRKQSGKKAGIALALENLGEVALAEKEYPIAVQYGEEALDIAQNIGNVNRTRQASKLLYQAYKITNQPAKSLAMHELTIQMRDSVQNVDNRAKALKFKFEQEAFQDSLDFVKTREIQQLTIQKQQSDIQRQRIGLLSAFGGLCLLIALALAIFKGKKAI